MREEFDATEIARFGLRMAKLCPFFCWLPYPPRFHDLLRLFLLLRVLLIIVWLNIIVIDKYGLPYIKLSNIIIRDVYDPTIV